MGQKEIGKKDMQPVVKRKRRQDKTFFCLKMMHENPPPLFTVTFYTNLILLQDKAKVKVNKSFN